MQWFQKPCPEAQDSFKDNKYLDDREIHYDPAIMSAFSTPSRRNPYFEGSCALNVLPPEQREKVEVIDPKSINASLHDVHVLKHLFQHFTSTNHDRFMLDNVAVFPLAEPGQGVVYAATNGRRIAFYHSRMSQANRFLMLEIPAEFLKAIKADRFGVVSPLEIQDGYLSAETNGARTALPLDKLWHPGLLFPDVTMVLPRRIEVRDLIGGHCPVMTVDDISCFAIKGVKNNFIRLLIPKVDNVMVFAENGLWGLTMSAARAFNEQAAMPPMFKEVWPHEGSPDPWAETSEEPEGNDVQVPMELAA
jgi:hypothetical protein